MSYFILGAAVVTLLHAGCFVAFLHGSSQRRLAMRVLALYWGIALLIVLPLATAAVARATSSGTALGAVVGAVLLVLWAVLAEGLWSGRGWVMYVLGVLGVLTLVSGYSLITADQAALGGLHLLSGLSLAGIAMQHLREVADLEPMELTDPAVEAAPAEPAV